MLQASLNTYSKNCKKNKNKYKKNNNFYFNGFIFFLIIFSTIIYGGWLVLNWIKNSNQLPISKLVITGKRYYTSDDDIKKAVLTLGIPCTFMTADINKIQNQIKTISWIKQVTVRKQWPNILNIYLIEYKPYAKWNDDFFIDEDGLVFNLPEHFNLKDNFLMLYGPQDTQHEVLEMYHVMQQQLMPYNFNIKLVSMTNRRSWKLVLENNIKLKIGKVDIKKRLNHFVKLYPLLKQKTDKHIKYIDLRYNNGAAVGWLSF